MTQQKKPTPNDSATNSSLLANRPAIQLNSVLCQFNLLQLNSIQSVEMVKKRKIIIIKVFRFPSRANPRPQIKQQRVSQGNEWVAQGDGSSTQNKSTQDLSKKTSDTVGDNSDSRGFEASKDNISLNIRTDHGPSIGFGLTVTLRAWGDGLVHCRLPSHLFLMPYAQGRKQDHHWITTRCDVGMR